MSSIQSSLTGDADGCNFIIFRCSEMVTSNNCLMLTCLFRFLCGVKCKFIHQLFDI